MTDDRLARLAGAPYAARLGVILESATVDQARIRVPYKDENSNPGRALHGGVAASTIAIAGTLASSTGFAGEVHEEGTLDLAVSYLAAAIGEDIVADAAVLRRGKEIVYTDVDVRNDAGKRIAKGVVTYRALDRPPAGADRQRGTQATPPRAEPGDVPPLARAIVSVPFIKSLGMSIATMADGHAVLAMPLGPEKRDHAGAVHEGALAALIDTTGAMASWSVVGIDLRYKASTVAIHVNFHRPAHEDLVAEARTWRRNDEIFLNQVTASERDSRRVVATGTVTYRIVVP